MGLIAPSLGDLAAYREAIGASDVGLFGNITPEFSSTIGTRTVAERARSASFLGLDVILISGPEAGVPFAMSDLRAAKQARSEEHTSELQSHVNLVCRLLLEKKK